jgi:hypothetical protein
VRDQYLYSPVQPMPVRQEQVVVVGETERFAVVDRKAAVAAAAVVDSMAGRPGAQRRVAERVCVV